MTGQPLIPLEEQETLRRRARRLRQLPHGEQGPEMRELALAAGVSLRTLQRYTRRWHRDLTPFPAPAGSYHALSCPYPDKGCRCRALVVLR